ncbi:hypothetical protein Ddye_009531 [Dipteronia dyeriana]|uniref:Uncharacterized protein n=1 Tax=Dipteronia dyeriana TaxID=168575 RepID=A0AAD9XBL0_9ROSI|nr:hypothetical protein Ddye_009531 [Dipteronia dyeriana]
MNFNVGGPLHFVYSTLSSSSFEDNNEDGVQLMDDLQAIDAKEEAMIKHQKNLILKLTAVFRMLAYRLSANATDEFIKI